MMRAMGVCIFKAENKLMFNVFVKNDTWDRKGWVIFLKLVQE